MRKKRSFLLTILTTEGETSSFCGQLKVIANGKTNTFTNIEEFHRLIMAEMDQSERSGIASHLNLDCDNEEQITQSGTRECDPPPVGLDKHL